jgi:hypothetical protein
MIRPGARCPIPPPLSDLTEAGVHQFIAALQDPRLSPRRLNYVVLVLKTIVHVALRRLPDQPATII